MIVGPRRQASCRHGRLNLLRQRLHALCPGHEDPDDHDELRHDAALQTAVDRDTVLVSASTLCRFESQADRAWMVSIHRVLMESFSAAPQELILDFDTTDDRVHGNQAGWAKGARDRARRN